MVLVAALIDTTHINAAKNVKILFISIINFKLKFHSAYKVTIFFQSEQALQRKTKFFYANSELLFLYPPQNPIPNHHNLNDTPFQDLTDKLDEDLGSVSPK